MNNTNRVSYLAIIALIFLLPIFFIPALSMPLGISKNMLLMLGSIVAFAALLVDSFKAEGLTVPRHHILWVAVALPIVYFISALLSKAPWLSLFGYAFEPGTAGSILLLSILFGITALVFRNRARIVKGYTALFVSLALLSVFAAVKILSGGDLLVLKNFAGNMGNPVGAWTDYAAIFGLLSILSVFALEMLHLRGISKALVWVLFVLSVAFLAIINFSTVWALVLAASVVLIVYFVTVDKAEKSGQRRAGIVAAGILGFVALLFIFNPTISSTQGSVANVTANFFGVNNTDVRPTLSTTLAVSKSAIAQSPVLGSGPNTFGSNWLLYKPTDINSTPFWNVIFPFGVGFVPTQIASTGILGTVVWIAFFILLALLGIKSFAKSPAERADRFLVVSSLIATLYLWIASFSYMPSMVMLALTFIFTGLFVAAASVGGVVGEKEIVFSKNALTHFVSVLLMIILAAGTLALAFAGYQKLSAAMHLQKALAMSNTEGASIEDVEKELMKAVNLSPTDSYFSALSQLELSKANLALNSATGTPQENSQAFQTSLARAIAYVQNAITLNPTYGNWVALGNIYASLVPAPLSVDGAYESALAAYNSAEAVNPTSPEISLLKAQLELAKKNNEAARTFVAEAISRKADYADAYFMLSQLEVSENNISQAIRSAETGVLLSPGNAGVRFQLGLLKFANKDYQGAAEAFQASLDIVPEYANAKYYLGLSLAELKRTEEAIALFEDLAETNPDNEAVALVLANLRAGKPAQTGLNNSGSTSRTTPPISGQ
jgi:tetratricopeptide (TPR) repeat protein